MGRHWRPLPAGVCFSKASQIGEGLVRASPAPRKRASRTGDAASLRDQLRQVRQALRELRERYEIAMGAINESVYDWDIAAGRFSTSRSMRETLNLPMDLRSIKAWQERIHPEDYDAFRDATVAHLKGLAKHFHCEYRYQAADGAWRWARTHGTALRDDRGRAVRLVGSTSDITELKRAQAALHSSEERYALATAAAHEGIYEWDILANTLFLSERAKSFFSLSADELTPAAWNSRIHGDDFPGYRAATVQHLKGRTPHFEHEYRIADGRGAYRWVMDRGIAVRDAAGRATKLVGALTDITERKRAELELRRARDEAQQALEEQAAAAEVLRAISSSTSDAKPVFDKILDSCQRLFEGHLVGLTLLDSRGLLDLVAYHGPNYEVLKEIYPVPVTHAGGSGWAILEKKVAHFPDVSDASSAPEIVKRGARSIGFKSILFAPLLAQGEGIGALWVGRQQVGPFSDREIALLKTFADQAVIAVQNARLFMETKEALERQTASAEVLKVISRTHTDLQRVFDMIAASAARLCRCEQGWVTRYDGELVYVVSHFNIRPEIAEIWKQLYQGVAPRRGLVSFRSIIERSVVHIADVQKDADYDQAAAQRAGYRSALAVPLLRNGEPIGAVAVTRSTPGPFSDGQIALLKTFAEQAVIAIENVRLFNETKEALDQQTATSEVLKVIARTTFDLQPVLDIVLANARKLCEADRAIIFRPDELGRYVPMAFAVPQGEPHRAMKEVFDRAPITVDKSSATGRAIIEGATVHIPDVAADAEYTRSDIALVGKYRTILAVPMLREGVPVGVLTLSRVGEPRPFSEKQIQLVRVFADQAVIAIENVRLFREIQEKSAQLEVANKHKSDFLASMSHELRTPLNAILGFNEMLLGEVYGPVPPEFREPLTDIQTSGKHLLRLINNVLDLAKIEAGRMELALGPYSPRDIVESVRATLRPLAADKGLEFSTAVEEDVPLAYGDSGRLTQCLMNLAGNALKFTRHGKVEIAVERCNGMLLYRVVDTGMGIPADKIGDLFAEFRQTDATIAREFGGSGLGLSITKKFVELHGGRIWVESQLGQGSTFAFTVPVQPTQRGAGER